MRVTPSGSIMFVGYMMSNFDYIIAAVALVLFIYEVVFYSVYIAAVPRLLRRLRKVKSADAPGYTKGVSIIISAHNEEANLNDYLQAILAQDYPTFEVIVVNDRSDDHTREVIETFAHRDSRVKTSFIPKATTVLSTKKLAITLGAKSAQYDILLLTDADCRPASNQWIRRMVAPFENPEVELVLGFSPYFEEPTTFNRMLSYDVLFNGLNYLGSALQHHPYMGVGRNMAYRKELFFRSGGFSDLMNHLGGDDDLFVRKVAKRKNTAVVATDDSFTWTTAKDNTEDWIQQRRRHLSVSGLYTVWSKLHLGMEPIVRGLCYVMLIVCPILALIGLLNWWIALGIAGLMLVRLILQLAIVNVAAKRMALRRYGLSLIVWDIYLPLVNLYIFMTAPFHRQTNRW